MVFFKVLQCKGCNTLIFVTTKEMKENEKLHHQALCKSIVLECDEPITIAILETIKRLKIID